ncbi:MAG: MoaD/ThiS family protein [Chloroflexota bacterium]
MTVELHLYGKLRRYAAEQAYDKDSVVALALPEGATLADALAALGIAVAEIGQAFVNGELSLPTRILLDGDRVGLFPENMSLLYKWYFREHG